MSGSEAISGEHLSQEEILVLHTSSQNNILEYDEPNEKLFHNNKNFIIPKRKFSDDGPVSNRGDFNNNTNNLLKIIDFIEDNLAKNIDNSAKKLRLEPTLSASSSQQCISVLSNHLKIYDNTAANIPPIKAEFVKNYYGFNFPIGVKVCVKRNWLICCDSGNHVIKILNRTTGGVIHVIRSCANVHLKRPSALLIDPENNNELFVKDDKEIFVFDMDKDCKLKRKFGLGILSHPYGLSFSNTGNYISIKLLLIKIIF